MEAFEAVRTVLAVREYRSDSIPAELVERIVEAGRLTASSRNLQPWRFIVVEDAATLRALGESVRSGPYIADAPLAIAIVVETGSRFGDSDASRAAQSMMLTAWSIGIGSNWVGFHGMERAAEILRVPDGFSLFAILPFGYPVAAIGKGEKRRKPASEVVFRGAFGEPY